MQLSPRPAPIPPVTPTAGDIDPDDRLLVRLHDRRLRALLATASGLSPQAQRRLGAAAESLRHNEGLQHPRHTAEL
ncbi:hypothetical protein [Nocardia thailandica]|uniref:hypothetical protein n=1 Tax=Nocardia thailandica TaxID=257275 RepID=UPI00031DE0E1|nr:hypothetical protein [Nocardia thailandica]